MKDFQYKLKAYFTVEAAMVFSVVLSVIMFLIYLMLFQYNRCLQEQDLGMLVVKSNMLQSENRETLMNELVTYRDWMDKEKYVAWEGQEFELEMEGERLSVSGEGAMTIMDNTWKAEAAYEGWLISPVFLIRTYRKLAGGE